MEARPGAGLRLFLVWPETSAFAGAWEEEEPYLNLQEPNFCRVPINSILGFIIRAYKKVGFGSLRYNFMSPARISGSKLIIPGHTLIAPLEYPCSIPGNP